MLAHTKLHLLTGLSTEELQNEAAVLRNLISPNIVQFYSMVVDERDRSRYLYIMEEWCECNLHDLLRDSKSNEWMTREKRLDILKCIASGLERVVEGACFTVMSRVLIF